MRCRCAQASTAASVTFLSRLPAFFSASEASLSRRRRASSACPSAMALAMLSIGARTYWEESNAILTGTEERFLGVMGRTVGARLGGSQGLRRLAQPLCVGAAVFVAECARPAIGPEGPRRALVDTVPAFVVGREGAAGGAVVALTGFSIKRVGLLQVLARAGAFCMKLPEVPAARHLSAGTGFLQQAEGAAVILGHALAVEVAVREPVAAERILSLTGFLIQL